MLINPVEDKAQQIHKYENDNTRIEILFFPRYQSSNEYAVYGYRATKHGTLFQSVYLDQYFDMTEKLILLADIRGTQYEYPKLSEQFADWQLLGDILEFAIHYLQD